MTQSCNANLLATIAGLPLQQKIERFWEVDSYATKQDPSEVTLSIEDQRALVKPDPSGATLSIEAQRALAVLQSSTVKEQGHYKTPLLWKGEPIMQNSRAMAVSRLHSTERKFKKDPELTVKYEKVINDYVNRGHPKKMTHEEAKLTSLRTWYLPHHAVLNSNKHGKVRLVFDAAV